MLLVPLVSIVIFAVSLLFVPTIATTPDAGLKEIPETGPLSWSVPGCVDGWDALRKRFGTQSFDRLLEPSIRYAEDGFPVTEVIAGYWHTTEAKLVRHPDAAKTFLIAGRGPILDSASSRRHERELRRDKEGVHENQGENDEQACRDPAGADTRRPVGRESGKGAEADARERARHQSPQAAGNPCLL